jgi:hypothetical protein
MRSDRSMLNEYGDILKWICIVAIAGVGLYFLLTLKLW